MYSGVGVWAGRWKSPREVRNDDMATARDRHYYRRLCSLSPSYIVVAIPCGRHVGDFSIALMWEEEVKTTYFTGTVRSIGVIGLRWASIAWRSASRKGGSASRSPRVAASSSTAKPGPSVAISNKTPPGSRK